MKPGHRTTEFITTLAFVIALGAGALANSLQGRYAAIAGAVAVAGYAISRGLAKSGKYGA